MKIQVTTTETQEKEIQLPYHIKVNENLLCKIVSETEVICAHVWDGISFKASMLELRTNAEDILKYRHEEVSVNEFNAHLKMAHEIAQDAYNKSNI